MKDLNTALEEKHAQIKRIQSEIDILEAAARLLTLEEGTSRPVSVPRETAAPAAPQAGNGVLRVDKPVSRFP